MLNLLILLTFIFAIYTGARRGFALQLVYTVGYFIVFLIAKKYYLSLVDKLEMLVPYPQPTINSEMLYYKGTQLFDVDRYFYAGISFALILFIGWAVVRVIGIFAYDLTFFPVIKEVNWALGGLLGFVVTLVTLCVLLNLLAMVPIGYIQNTIDKSFLAKMIIEHTLFFSKGLVNLWMKVPV